MMPTHRGLQCLPEVSRHLPESCRQSTTASSPKGPWYPCGRSSASKQTLCTFHIQLSTTLGSLQSPEKTNHQFDAIFPYFRHLHSCLLRDRMWSEVGSIIYVAPNRDILLCDIFSVGGPIIRPPPLIHTFTWDTSHVNNVGLGKPIRLTVVPFFSWQISY